MKKIIIFNLLILTLFNITVFSQTIEETAALAACECAKNAQLITVDKYKECIIRSVIKVLENQYGKLSYSLEGIESRYKKTDSITRNICDSIIFLKLSQEEIDGVYFSYFPLNHYPVESLKFKFLHDTLFVYKDVSSPKELYSNYILCQKIANEDTVSFVKEFVRLFITDKTENIILKDAKQMIEANYTIVHINAYINGIVTYKKYIIMNPEREYHPKFLQLCDLFLSIARGTR